MFQTKSFAAYVLNMERVRFLVAISDAYEARAALVANAERIEASIADAYVRGSDAWRMSERHVPACLRHSARVVYVRLLLLRLRNAGFHAELSAAGTTLEVSHLGSFNFLTV